LPSRSDGLTWQLEERHFLGLHCGADVGYLLVAGGWWLVCWWAGVLDKMTNVYVLCNSNFFIIRLGQNEAFSNVCLGAINSDMNRCAAEFTLITRLWE